MKSFLGVSVGLWVTNLVGSCSREGFIDVHTHADELAERPLAENFVRMGVTTVNLSRGSGAENDIAARPAISPWRRRLGAERPRGGRCDS